MLDDNRYLELIGLKVKLLRQRKRMSQQELAELVNITLVKKIDIRKRPRKRQWERICPNQYDHEGIPGAAICQ